MPRRLNYNKLDKWGLPRQGEFIEEDDVVICKYIKTKDETGADVEREISTTTKKDNEGSFIDRVYTWQTNAAGDRAVKIRTCQNRPPVMGDKFASRCAQKGTFGITLKREDFPYTEDGITPDIIFDPASIPTRMTVSQFIEILFGNMAAELGLNPKLAKRAGLLHDIGKVPDEETELSHALLGAKLAEKYGENPAVVNAIGAHHDEMEMQFVISPIIQACDAISGARPGARREIMQQYLQRIKDLENLAMAYTGVEKAYAIQAGRELRVIVEAEKVTDADSDKLSFEIAQKIQNEMTFPGQIKVTVIREKRAINVAR